MTREARIDRERPLGAPGPRPQDLDWSQAVEARFSQYVRHPAVPGQLARDAIPLPAVEDREHYHAGRDHQYWISGFADYSVISSLMPAGFFERDLRILDFGGCSGRVARHFVTARPATKLTIAEANVNYVNWVNTHFGDNCRAEKVGPQPVLPFRDAAFDFAYATSVFTHIDRDEAGWLRELTRVVRDGGYLYLTVLCDHSWEAMDRELLFATVKAARPGNEWLAAAIGKPMPVERFSVPLEFDDIVHNWNTFHSCAYIRRTWSEFATVERIEPLRHWHQAAVILRNDRRHRRDG